MKKAYLCKPKKKSRATILVCIALLFFATLSFFFASKMSDLRAIGQMLAVVLLLLFVQFSTKFLFTDYEYALEDGTLRFSSHQGKRIKNLGGIPITSRCVLLTQEEWEEKKKTFAVKNQFSYCQNLFPEKVYVLLCPQEKGFVSLRFEPDEILVSLLREQMSEENGEDA